MAKKRARSVEKENEGDNAGGKPNNIYIAHNKAGETIPHTDLSKTRSKLEDGTDMLRIACWNINGLRAFMAKRSKELKKFWEKEHLDILGITEHKITDSETCKRVEEEICNLLGKDVCVVWNMCTTSKGYSGTLAITRKSVFSKCKVSFGLGVHEEDLEGRVITMEFPTLAVVICYVPNSGQELKRLSYRTRTWDKALSNHCLGLKSSGKRVVLAGDLNVAHRDCDIWNVDAPHVPKGAGTTPEERHSFEKQFLDRGFTDTFAKKYPDATGWFTYWSVRAGNKPKNRGLRLDYVLTAGEVDVLDAYVLPEYAVNGDHAPVGVTISNKF